jgi:hypothetical protein
MAMRADRIAVTIHGEISKQQGSDLETAGKRSRNSREVISESPV